MKLAHIVRISDLQIHAKFQEDPSTTRDVVRKEPKSPKTQKSRFEKKCRSTNPTSIYTQVGEWVSGCKELFVSVGKRSMEMVIVSSNEDVRRHMRTY